MPDLVLALGLLATCFAIGRVAAQSDGIKTGTFPFADIDVYYQMKETDNKDDPTILFLHGQAFTSDVWVKQGTLEQAADNKFRAMAVDLPGYGKTKRLPYVDNNMRAELIKTALEFAAKDRSNPNVTSVLVSPSMSGRWAIPFLDRYGLMLCGFVAVAPVGVKSWGGPWEYTHKHVKLLAMYGDQDPMKADGEYLTKLFYKSKMHVIPEAGHACYMDKPEAFNDQLFTFLKTLDPEEIVRDPFDKSREL